MNSLTFYGSIQTVHFCAKSFLIWIKSPSAHIFQTGTVLNHAFFLKKRVTFAYDFCDVTNDKLKNALYRIGNLGMKMKMLMQFTHCGPPQNIFHAHPSIVISPNVAHHTPAC
ncbi:hypothetical protein EVA_12259 [gut metagenome]|uniref:Uncharacterized protein n=1 Tax=gut metagenome TaxID=749906 RepID=J9GJ89_9ZZZZ